VFTQVRKVSHQQWVAL